MNSNEIWTNIIIPLLIGPFFLYLKSLYDNYVQNRKEHKLLVYTNKNDHYKDILNKFYWPLYLKLLCICQLNYTIPFKNKYEYISDEDNSDNSDKDDNITINIQNENMIMLDTETIKLMEQNINILFSEALNIIENNIYIAKISSNLNKNIIQFIKYCKLREVIHEGSIDKKYNIEYFGIKDNTKKLLDLIELDVLRYQGEYNLLIDNGPFK